MRVAFRRLTIGVAAFGFSVFAQGQTAVRSGNLGSVISANGDVVRGAMGFPGPMAHYGSPVTDAPYSAQRVSEHVLVAADGTRFTNTNQRETIYRDSQGRIRTERSLMMGPNAPAEAPVIVEIQDPVASVSYTLDAPNKVAHRVAWTAAPNRQAGVGDVGTGRSGTFSTLIAGGPSAPPPPPPPGSGVPNAIVTSPVPSRAAAAAATGAGRQRPEITSEDLGQQVIEGVAAEGRRRVETWPAGAVGNDRPFQVVSENWFSPEIKETVLSTTADPRSGESTTKLINIDRGEPSASLFVPPPDYTVVDEKGPFQIQWTGPRE